MNSWDWILTTPIISGLGWAVVHSIWQTCILGAITFFGLQLISVQKAQMRYLFAYTILLITGGLFIWNFNYHFQVASANSTKIALYSDPGEKDETGKTKLMEHLTPIEPIENKIQEPNSALVKKEKFSLFTEILLQIKPFVKKSLPWLALIWIMGVLVLGVKMVGSWFYLKYWTKKTAKTVAPYWQQNLDKLKNRLGIRKPIRLLESSELTSPLTFGWLKPVILVPLGMLSQLSPDQIEAVLLHELAHIRRYDFGANIIQSLIEILLFFHPVVWWISRKVKESREDCCDDIAAAHCRNRLHYANSLLQIQKYSLNSTNQLTMAATGNSGRLTARIHRLFLNSKTTNNLNIERIKPLLSILLVFGFLSLYAFTDFFSIANKTVSIAADKMNVFYIGVNNPVTVAVAEIPSEKIRLTSKDVVIENQGNGHYNVLATKPGNAVIQVSGKGMETSEVTFRIKKIPDPIAVLDISGILKRGGTILAKDFRQVKGINLSFSDFVFDVNMQVTGFRLTRVAKNEDPVEVIADQGNFNERTKQLVEMAKPGDIYYIDDVKVDWKEFSGSEEHKYDPGYVNSMVFKMK